MSENKRTTPMSELDLKMLMTNPAWTEQNIPKHLQDRLKHIISENDEEVEFENLYELLAWYQRDLRLGNLSSWDGEVVYCHYYLDLASDCIKMNLAKSFITCLSRVATVIEISQSKSGFLRKLPTKQEHLIEERNNESKKKSGFFGRGGDNE